jgi:uncharacterized membrane protein YdjX (TVP38/TMEM64 family)
VSRWRIAGLVALGVALATLALSLDLAGLVPRLRTRIEGLGGWGPVAYVALYVPATMVGIPGTPFTVVAPVLFGGIAAFVTMVVASTLSAAGAFLVSRHLARDAVTRRLGSHPLFKRLDRLLDQHAWIVIPFVRVVPFPFVVNNYGLGLTRIGFWRYLAWSEVGMIPMNALLVLGTDSVLRAVSGNMSWTLTGLTVVAAGAITVLAVVGRRRWREAERAEAMVASRRGC